MKKILSIGLVLLTGLIMTPLFAQKVELQLPVTSGIANSLKSFDDGRYALRGTDQYTQIWETAEGRLVKQIPIKATDCYFAQSKVDCYHNRSKNIYL
jgi:hypothetical protein